MKVFALALKLFLNLNQNTYLLKKTEGVSGQVRELRAASSQSLP